MAEFMIYINTHDADEGLIIAMCDESLIGKTLEEGDIFINLDLYASFYKGELVKSEKAMAIIDQSKKRLNSANVIGKEAIEVALQAGLIAKDNVLRVQKVPYAHTYVVRGNQP